MENDGKRVTQDTRSNDTLNQLAIYIPVALAACAVFSTSWMVGTAVGTGQPDIMWVLTFSDIVNNAIPMMPVFLDASIIAFVGIYAWEKAAQKLPYCKTHPRSIFASLSLFLCAVAIGFWGVAVYLKVTPWLVLFMLVLSPILLLMATAWWIQCSDKEPPKKLIRLALWFQACVYSAAVLGVYFSFHAVHAHRVIIVKTAETPSPPPTNFALSLDRGTAIVRPSGFQLVPWGDVKSLTLFEDFGELGGKEIQPPKPIPKK